MKALRRHPPALGSERGAMLVEAMVAAALLVVLALGFLASIDTAARSSGALKNRAAGASLAQDDIERLRALKVRDLVGLNQSRQTVLNGVRYTIASRAIWIDDATGSSTCPSGATKSDYLKITSTVTWPFMGTVKPVKNESIVAVPLGSLDGTSGGLIVRIQDRDGDGVPGVPVGLTGTATNSGTTDADGCVFWTTLAEGPYDIGFSRSGWVDKEGDSAITKAATVTPGTTNSFVFDYDQAAKLDVTFDTQVSGSTLVGRGDAFMVANTGIPTPGTRTFTQGTPSSSMSSGYTLFPFFDAYVAWAGRCTGADPRQYGASAGSVSFNPGGSASLTLREPALNVRIQRGGVAFPTARVRITPVTPGCGTTYDGGALNANGSLQHPGQPYGDYTVCADDGARRIVSGTIQNRNPAGTSTITLSIPTSSGAGTCA